MYQHIPLLLWMESHQRGPSYLECVREGLLPSRQPLLCEETLCRGVCHLSDVLTNDSRHDFVRALLKTLPRRCQPRDVEDQALSLLSSDQDGFVSRVFRWARLGNARHVTWRPSLVDRLRIFTQSHAQVIELAKNVPRSLSGALSEFVAVAIRDCHPYCAVMQKHMFFDEFWHNACQLADRVYRPHLVNASKGIYTDETLKAVSLWQKKNRKAVVAKPSQNVYMSLYRILNKTTNTLQKPAKKYVFNAMLVASYPSNRIVDMLANHPHMTPRVVKLFQEKWPNAPKKAIKNTIEKILTDEEVHHLASFLHSYLRPHRVSLSPLPWHFYEKQKDQHRTYRACPQCCAYDFFIQGYDHSPTQFPRW